MKGVVGWLNFITLVSSCNKTISFSIVVPIGLTELTASLCSDYHKSCLTFWFVSTFPQDLLACILHNILEDFVKTHPAGSSVNYVFLMRSQNYNYIFYWEEPTYDAFPVVLNPDIYLPQGKVMFSKVFVCPRGADSLSRGVYVQQVSAQECSLSGGSLFGFLYLGISFWGCLCPGSLCLGVSLSAGVP